MPWKPRLIELGETGHEAGIMLNGKLTPSQDPQLKYGTSDMDWLRNRVDPCARRHEGKPKLKYLLPLDDETSDTPGHQLGEGRAAQTVALQPQQYGILNRWRNQFNLNIARRILCSLDHLIRSLEHAVRNGETNLFCRFEVYDEFKLRCLLHWQISRFGAFQDLVNIVGRASIEVRVVRTIGH